MREAVAVPLTHAAKKPACPKSLLMWQHGNYSMNDSTNELFLDPYAPDGRMQISDPCSGKDTIQYYTQCVK